MSPHLSFDIQVEVIKRLPVKSLIQCRSVCKAWNSLIGSSRFVAGYNFRHDHSEHEHLLVKYETVDWQETRMAKYVWFVDDDTFPQQKFFPTLPPLFQLLYHSKIIDSSCGLFCFYGFFREPDHSKTDMVVLWNPSIRKSIAVVVPKLVSKLLMNVVGFGVCPGTKDPKLVKITYIQSHRKMGSISCIPNQVMVFTLSTGEWTCLCSDRLPRKSIQFDNTRQTVVGRFIYWVAYDWIVFGDQFSYHCLIMSFDLSTNEFREVHLPNSLANKCVSDLSISRLRESLAVVEYATDITGKRVCTVWLMEHGDSRAFTKLFTINATNISFLLSLAFKKSGEPILEIKLDGGYPDSCTGLPLVVYERCSGHIKDLGICGNGFPVCASFYTESLLLLDHEDGHIIKSGVVNKCHLEQTGKIL